MSDHIWRFVLYLRPFAVDALFFENPAYVDARNKTFQEVERLSARHQSLPLELTMRKLPQMFLNLEHLLDGIDSMKAICLSRKPDDVVEWRSLPRASPLRLASADGKWFRIFETLSSAATLIVCVPWFSPGTRLEVESLKTRGLLHRCVFLVRGSPGDKGWIMVAERLAGVIQFPASMPVARAGDPLVAVTMFTVNAAGAVLRTERFDLNDKEHVISALRSLQRLGLEVPSGIDAAQLRNALLEAAEHEIQAETSADSR